ncbi:MAG: molybdate ABC transporter substrate-binding protein [Chloroflexota bacterium]
MKRPLLLVLLAALLLPLGTVRARQGGELIVFAAASLTDAYETIADAFEAENPGVNVLFNFGGSSMLAAQLLQGAPTDVFASANPRQMQVAQEGGRIATEPRTFARNRLVLVVPADNPANIESLRDLANPGVNLILAVPEVPVRVYTDTMLERMAADPAYGEAYRAAVLDNLVSEEPNVRQVSAKVALGEADAGVVYLSDVTPDIADDVIVLPVPDAFNTNATYPIAVVSDSRQPELAQAFIDFVLSDAGQDMLVAWGFVSIREPSLPDTVTVPTDGTLLVDGLVADALTLSPDTLRTAFTAQSVDVDGARVTGALLWDVLSVAQLRLDADEPDDALSLFVVVTGVDGAQVVFSWGEIDPAYGGEPVLIAYDETGPLRLVVPGDEADGRFLQNVASISLRAAPRPAGG